MLRSVVMVPDPLAVDFREIDWRLRFQIEYSIKWSLFSIPLQRRNNDGGAVSHCFDSFCFYSKWIVSSSLHRPHIPLVIPLSTCKGKKFCESLDLAVLFVGREKIRSFLQLDWCLEKEITWQIA